jgi:hypothetical protein
VPAPVPDPLCANTSLPPPLSVCLCRLCARSHFGNEFTAAFEAVLSAALKTRAISVTDASAVADDAEGLPTSPTSTPSRATSGRIDGKPSIYRRLSQRDPE